MQTAVNKALKLVQKNDLTFAPDKTVAVIFTRKKVHWNRIAHIKMGDKELKYEKKAPSRFQGGTFKVVDFANRLATKAKCPFLETKASYMAH